MLHHPKTITQAVDLALTHLPDHVRHGLQSDPDGEWRICAHLGIGLWIRNNLIHANRFKEQLESDFIRLQPDAPLVHFVPDADTISAYIIKCLVHRIATTTDPQSQEDCSTQTE